MSSVQKVAAAMVSYWRFFCIIFVSLFIFLTGNVVYLWKWFGNYAFFEFLQSLALVSVLWSIISVFVTLLVWLIFMPFEWLCIRKGWKIRIEHLFLYAGFFILFGALLWKGKRIIWHNAQMTLQLKLIVFICVGLVSIFITRLFRNYAERWIIFIQKRITPLVWLFGVCVVLSVPLAAYQTWQEIQMYRQDTAFNIKNQQPLVTFVFDEVRESIYKVTKPVFDAQTEVACVGIVLDIIGSEGQMTADQILELQSNGWEVVGHSKTHPDLTTLTEEEIEDELKISKDGFSALGYKVTNFTYPYHTHNSTVRKIAGKYYRAARSGPEWATGFDVNPHILRIYALSSFEVESRHDLAVLKGYVDYAEANNSWLIFTMHEEITRREVVLNSLIDYIQEKGIRIVTMNQALDLIGDKGSILGELLFILNHETPLSGNILRRVHIAGQRLLSLLQDNLLMTN